MLRDFIVTDNSQDNVFVNVVASVQYRAMAEKAADAFYRLTNTKEQIQSYVFDGMTSAFSFSFLCKEANIFLFFSY